MYASLRRFIILRWTATMSHWLVPESRATTSTPPPSPVPSSPTSSQRHGTWSKWPPTQRKGTGWGAGPECWPPKEPVDTCLLRQCLERCHRKWLHVSSRSPLHAPDIRSLLWTVRSHTHQTSVVRCGQFGQTHFRHPSFVVDNLVRHRLTCTKHNFLSVIISLILLLEELNNSWLTKWK